jgi:GH15 family glucan-1,4-alpha-glucosidase
MDLLARSIKIILENQHASGAYIASPNFPMYRYCWFRDASYIAYAMDRVGEFASAARFHDWATRTILAHRAEVQRGLRKLAEGKALDAGEYIHTRYHLDGAVETDGEWPNFQLDGIGTWLWSLAEHLRLTDATIGAAHHQAIELCIDYLSALWDRPCYDCWEERPDQVHTYTLSALYRGLKSSEGVRSNVSHVLSAIEQALRTRAVLNDHLIKDLDGADEVDGNLLAVTLPNRVLPLDESIVRTTVERIENDLSINGAGVHRYAADTYYGGGEWILLTAWLGQYYAALGEADRAREFCTWIENCADAQGHLPEQLETHLNHPEYLDEWRRRWGESARPLLWSHAEYIVLRSMLDHG